MKVCINCFQDKFIKEYINKNGEINNCNYCNSEDIKCLEASMMGEHFGKLLKMFVFKKTDRKPEFDKHFPDGYNLSFLCEGEFKIFNTDYLNTESQNKLLDDIMKTCILDEEIGSASEPYWKSKVINYFVNIDDEVLDFWNQFNNIIKKEYRYFFDDINPLKYISENILTEFTLTIEENREFYRGRKGYEYEKGSFWMHKIPYKDMGAPPSNMAKGGRANSIGITCLYLATNIETVISEVRPYKGEEISVAKFKLVKDIKVLDLSKLNNTYEQRIVEGSPFIYDDITKRIIHMKFMHLLSIAMSTPINSEQYKLEYLPMQYYMEYFKKNKLDGILYKSAMGNEKNLVIFNQNKVEEIDKRIFKVRDIRYMYNILAERRKSF